VCNCFTVKVFVSNFKAEKGENLDNAFYVFFTFFWSVMSKKRKKSRFFEFSKKNVKNVFSNYDWRDVVVTSSARHQTCSRILDRLQPAHETFSDAVKQWVAVVQATGNERLDQRLYSLFWYKLDERSELPQLVISTATHGGHLCRQRQLTVDDDFKVMRRLSWDIDTCRRRWHF